MVRLAGNLFHFAAAKAAITRASMSLFLVLGSFFLALRPCRPSGPALPAGVIDTQRAEDRLAPAVGGAQRMTVPHGFQVTLFAGEPDVLQPIAFEFDDRGRL